MSIIWQEGKKLTVTQGHCVAGTQKLSSNAAYSFPRIGTINGTCKMKSWICFYMPEKKKR